jgi:2-polyprenyl-3-methyl-5-hydroxy-6-metoxy-1,4-benzoquinol methylase
MSILQLKSSNPEFSYIIKKNPNSGMIIKSIRKGHAFGWYSNDDTYNIYFKDAENDISYKEDKDQQFEYLNVSRYNTPLFPLNAISEFLKSTLNEQTEQDQNGYLNVLTVNMLHIELVRYIDFFKKHYPDYNFETKHLAHKSYTLTISTNQSVYKLLNVASSLFIFLAMFGKEYLDVSDNLIAKYIQCINVTDAPYYIRSLFVRNFLSTKARLNKFKNEIEATNKYKIDFEFGNTAQQRRNYIEKIISFNKPIIDIGCGEGFYMFPFSKRIKDHEYHAIDTNKEIVEILEAKIKARNIKNVLTHKSVEDFLESYQEELSDVILTEVVEHLELDEAKKLIKKVYDNINFDKFIITTPNFDFNKFYDIDIRHDDHKWEMTSAEFKGWILTMFQNDTCKLDFFGIGDRVNGIQTTQGVIIRKEG